MKQLLAFTSGKYHPSSRLRIAAYESHFSRLGWNLKIHHFDSGVGKVSPRTGSHFQSIARRTRRVWQTGRATMVLRKLPPNEPIIISRELPINHRPFLNARNPMVLDIDDALYLDSGRNKLFELCRRAQMTVCGNKTLADEISKFSQRCVVIPTAVDVEQYRVRADHKLDGLLRLGWLGSSMSIEQTLLPFAKKLDEIRRRQPLKLVVISDEVPKVFQSADWLRFLKWSPAVEKSIADYMDVGIMPLEDNPYQRAKCAAKLLQYMAAGLPVIASPVGVNREIVTDDMNGFLAEHPNDWQRAVQQLAEQETLRAAFGKAGREFVVQNYSIAQWADQWVDLLNEFFDRPA